MGALLEPGNICIAPVPVMKARVEIDCDQQHTKTQQNSNHVL